MSPHHFTSSAQKCVPKAIPLGFSFLFDFYHMLQTHGLSVDLHVFNFKRVLLPCYVGMVIWILQC